MQPQSEPDPAYRRNVGLMLVNRERQVWVGQRLDFPGAWQMPQGGIDPGETPRVAALRELEEEIGTAQAEILFESQQWLAYDFPPEIAAKVGRGQYRGQVQRWFILRFTGSDNDIVIETAHPEFGSWRWVDRAQLPSLVVGFKRPLYEAVLAWADPLLKGLER